MDVASLLHLTLALYVYMYASVGICVHLSLVLSLWSTCFQFTWNTDIYPGFIAALRIDFLWCSGTYSVYTVRREFFGAVVESVLHFIVKPISHRFVFSSMSGVPWGRTC